MGNDSEVFMEKSGLNSNESLIINELQKIDLSKEEAEIYLCLLKNKTMTVREINQSIPQIQRTYLYNLLDNLKDQWVHINKASKPQTFNPIPPNTVIKQFIHNIEEKRNVLISQLAELEKLEKTTLPDLLNKLNELHQKDSLENIPIQYKPIFTEFFKNNPSIRIEYKYNPININPYLNFFFVSCNFHGFFISWHKKPISDEYSIHFYEFENPVSDDYLELSDKLLELQGAEMITLLTEREGIDQVQPVEQQAIKINGEELTQETFSYIKNGNTYQAIITHPWKLNKNTIAFFYANQKENGKKLLEWILEKLK